MECMLYVIILSARFVFKDINDFTKMLLVKVQGHTAKMKICRVCVMFGLFGPQGKRSKTQRPILLPDTSIGSSHTFKIKICHVIFKNKSKYWEVDDSSYEYK